MCLYVIDEGCAKLTYGDQSFDGTVKYSPMNWFETPAVVKLEAGNEFIKYIYSCCHIYILLSYWVYEKKGENEQFLKQGRDRPRQD